MMRTIADATTHPTLPSGLKWPVSPSPSPSSPSASSSGSDVPPPPLVRTLPSSSDASRRPPKSDTPKSSVRRRGHVGVPASGRVEAGVRLQVPLPSWDMGRPRQRRHSGACHAVHTEQAAVHSQQAKYCCNCLQGQGQCVGVRVCTHGLRHQTSPFSSSLPSIACLSVERWEHHRCRLC